MTKEFNCPACTAPMTFGGGESIFQTCPTCHAPIVVPSEIFYPKGMQIASENFATLANDIAVDVEQVTNELTPGDNLPTKSEMLDPGAKIEKFEIYQEKIGTSSIRSKKEMDDIITSNDEFNINQSYGQKPQQPSAETAQENAAPIMERIRYELRSGDKIEAIKIYKAAFGTSLKEAKETIDKMEREEFAGR